MNYVLYFFLFLELIAHLYVIMWILDIIEKRYENFINRCIKDVDFRNNFISYFYFFKDMGPGMSAVSIPTLIINGADGKAFLLLIVFLIGIMSKEISRKMINSFYVLLRQRGGKDYVYRNDYRNDDSKHNYTWYKI